MTHAPETPAFTWIEGLYALLLITVIPFWQLLDQAALPWRDAADHRRYNLGAFIGGMAGFQVALLLVLPIQPPLWAMVGILAAGAISLALYHAISRVWRRS